MIKSKLLAFAALAFGCAPVSGTEALREYLCITHDGKKSHVVSISLENYKMYVDSVSHAVLFTSDKTYEGGYKDKLSHGFEASKFELDRRSLRFSYRTEIRMKGWESKTARHGQCRKMAAGLKAPEKN